MKAILIRHGKTKGNAEQRYIGTTDECLTNEGIEEILNLKCGNGGKNEKHFADEFIHGFLV